MNDPRPTPGLIIDKVLHPSDYSPSSEIAFAHALKIALVAGARLTLLHVTASETKDWSEFPGVRPTLERWGLLPLGSTKHDVPSLGIEVRKAIERHSDPAKSVLEYLARHGADFIVLAPHRQAHRVGWHHTSVSEPVARESHQLTLLIPEGIQGFVSRDSGAVRLRTVLVPVASDPQGQAAVDAAARLVQALGCPQGEFVQLHVGREADAPFIPDPPSVPGWTWRNTSASGGVVDRILGTAGQIHADLIALTTTGRHGFLDALRGSHSEQVLRQANCPVLVVPAYPH